ncbi:silencing defective protein Sde2 [Tyrophagus putrescentiae]|nr:silencing defective protein Sde2 [Tyrophagus putrescentiae]
MRSRKRRKPKAKNKQQLRLTQTQLPQLPFINLSFSVFSLSGTCFFGISDSMHTFIYRSPCNSYRTQIFQLQPGSPTTTTTSAQAIKNCILEKEGLPPGTELNVWIQTKRLTDDEFDELLLPARDDDSSGCGGSSRRFGSKTEDASSLASSSSAFSSPFTSSYQLGHYTSTWQSTITATTTTTTFLDVRLPLVGGKGGFGSMLRAIGAQIEKTTNREACRDLSGRRLRDVNEEKRLKEWVKRQAEKKDEAGKKKKEKLRRLAEATVPASCTYEDEEHERTRAEIPDLVEESIIPETSTSESGTKRKADQLEEDEQSSSTSSSGSGSASVVTPATSTVASTSQAATSQKATSASKKPHAIKKQALWLGVDIDSEEDSDSSDSQD